MKSVASFSSTKSDTFAVKFCVRLFVNLLFEGPVFDPEGATVSISILLVEEEFCLPALSNAVIL